MIRRVSYRLVGLVSALLMLGGCGSDDWLLWYHNVSGEWRIARTFSNFNDCHSERCRGWRLPAAVDRL